MGEIDPTCTTPETLTMNVSMKLKDYRNCQNISDFNQVKNAVTKLIYSKEFLDRCKGMYVVDHGITGESSLKNQEKMLKSRRVFNFEW